MKKLMIAAFAVAFAAVAQAATVTWSATSGYLYNGAATPDKITSGDAYLMLVTATFTQSDLVAAFADAKGDAAVTLAAMSASGALATGTGTIGSNARIDSVDSTIAITSDATGYFVVFANDNMYVSDVAEFSYDPVSTSAEGTFGSMTKPSKLSFDAGEGYQSAGWYAVPEPTSGLMMLLGMGVLALRRRRA